MTPPGPGIVATAIAAPTASTTIAPITDHLPRGMARAYAEVAASTTAEVAPRARPFSKREPGGPHDVRPARARAHALAPPQMLVRPAVTRSRPSRSSAP